MNIRRKKGWRNFAGDLAQFWLPVGYECPNMATLTTDWHPENVLGFTGTRTCCSLATTLCRFQYGTTKVRTTNDNHMLYFVNKSKNRTRRIFGFIHSP